MGRQHKNKLISKIILLGVVITMVSVDAIPALSYATDVLLDESEDSIIETPEESEEGESVEGKDTLEIEVQESEGDNEPEKDTNNETGLTPEEITPEEPKEEDSVEENTPIKESRMRTMSASIQTENTYVMATDADFSGTTNGNFKYIGDDDYVEIPHKIKGVNVTSYQKMFEWTNVRGVKSTNKNITDMSYMFYSLQSETLDVSQLDTTNVANMGYMFSARSSEGNDTMLKRMDLSKFYTGKVKHMYNMFGYSLIENLDLSSFDTTNVTSMGYMFRGAYSKTIDLSSFNTTNVTDMSAMFFDIKTTDIDVSSFDTSNVTTMDKMFGASWNGWNLIEKLDIRNFDTTRVTNMSSMFRGTLVRELDLSNFNTSNVTNMGDMFYEADIQYLDLSSFDTRKVEHMNAMFYNSLATKINLSSFRTPSLINMGRMFMSSRVESLDLSNLDTSKVITMTEMFRNSKVGELDLTSFDTSKVNVMGDMFRDSKATKIDLSSFNTGNVKNMGFMFYNTSVKDLDLSHFDTSKVTNMSYMFTDSKATTLDVSNFDTRNVESMDNIFEGSHAQTLDLSSFNTQRITNMSSMFRNTQATVLNLKGWDTKYVTTMEGMFENVKVNTLDLSSFNMASVNDTTGMFTGVTSKIGLGRANDDANKLNNSSGKPEGLTFNPIYKEATDEDFSGFYNGNFRYIGKSEYIEMPKSIKGTVLTSYANLFENTKVKGVISDNTKITDMSNMFKGNTSEELDVSSLNTSNVATMQGLFHQTKALTLDMSNFITTKVKDMSNMFNSSDVTRLDLGSFDLASTTNTNNMFQNTKATIGYARTKEDLNKLNSTSNKPNTLSFNIWGIRTEQPHKEWTNSSVDIKVNAESDLQGISYVEMVNEPGRNLIKGTANGSSNETYKGLGVTTKSRDITTGYTDTYSSKTVEPVLGGTYTLSFYAKSTKDKQGFRTFFYSPNTTTDSKNNQGYENKASDGASVFFASTEWERYWVTYTQTPSSTVKNIIVGRLSGVSNISIAGVKLEEGSEASPWTPAPEDSATTGDQKDTFTVYSNGTYIFRATDKTGNTKTVAHIVPNIDTVNPKAEISSSPEGWTSQEVKIYVNAKDELSGVDYITLPNGNKEYKDKVEYPVSDNGIYEFKVTDKAGNTTSYKETIANIDKTVTKLEAKVENTEWTRGTVNIGVTSGESMSGLTDIIMANSPSEGRNLIKNSGLNIRLTKDSPFVGTQEYLHVVDGIDLTETFLGKDTTFSYYQHSIGERENSPRVSLGAEIRSRFGIHGALIYRDSKSTKPDTVVYPFASNLNSRTDNKRVSQTQRMQHYDYDKIVSYSLAVQPFAKPAQSNDEEWVLKDAKLEVGKQATPYTPAPEDIKLDGNSKVYPVASNGLYTFKATYKNGATSEASVNVTNIDREAPKVGVTGNVEDWTEEDKLTLTINAEDTQSGVKSITLPDGKVVNAKTVTYDVMKNGDYEFIVTDNVGNTTKHKEAVEYMMIPYSFYIYDNKGKPVKGSEFELLRNGEYYKTAISDVTGLVTFGKVPPDGKYQVRQVTAPGGVVLDPKDIENGDFTDPIEVVTYPRGLTLPGTGTLGLTAYTALALGLMMVLLGVKRKKRDK